MTDPAPEELLRLNLVPSDGCTPAGTLALVHALATQASQQTGAALPAEADRHRPETHEERSDKIVAVDNVAELVARNAAALNQLHAILAEMVAAGYSVNFELKSTAAGVRSGE